MATRTRKPLNAMLPGGFAMCHTLQHIKEVAGGNEQSMKTVLCDGGCNVILDGFKCASQFHVSIRPFLICLGRRQILDVTAASTWDINKTMTNLPRSENVCVCVCVCVCVQPTTIMRSPGPAVRPNTLAPVKSQSNGSKFRVENIGQSSP
jgi:hypothetical protein